jgi:hypothetical protein
MERIETQSLAWRLFAVLVALVLALTQFVRPSLPALGLDFQTAKIVYWLMAPIGLLGHAYGVRFFGETFWKVYSVIFTVDSFWRMVRTMPAGGHSVPMVIVVFGAMGLICVALMRYGNLFGRREDPVVDVFR